MGKAPCLYAIAQAGTKAYDISPQPRTARIVMKYNLAWHVFRTGIVRFRPRLPRERIPLNLPHAAPKAYRFAGSANPQERQRRTFLIVPKRKDIAYLFEITCLFTARTALVRSV